MREFLEKVANKQSLRKEEMKTALELMLTESVSESEIAAFIFGLKLKGETAEEIVGIVEAMQAKAPDYSHTPRGVMDNCGTGGDSSNSFNISTTTAFVLAGAGIPIAKHGNRSITSKSGSADVLEQLGVNLYLSNEVATQLLNEVGITFLYAPHIHNTFKKVMKVRHRLKVPTIFNLIGPLTNPVSIDYQMVGMYDRDMLSLFAKVLKNLGRERAVLINGFENMDEASLAGNNHLVILDKNTIFDKVVHPNHLGLPIIANEKITGGTAKENSEILKAVLLGRKSPYYYTVLFNAAIGIFAAGKVSTIEEGIEVAQASIHSGRAYNKLINLIKRSSAFKKVGN